MKKITLFAGMLCLMAIACQQNEKVVTSKAAITYPATKKIDHVDTYHGVEVADPYRWLEDDRSTETGEWVKAQNEVTFGYLDNIPFKNELQERIEKLNERWNTRNFPKSKRLFSRWNNRFKRYQFYQRWHLICPYDYGRWV